MEQTFGEESRFIRATKDNILLKRLGTLRRKKVLLQNRNLNVKRNKWTPQRIMAFITDCKPNFNDKKYNWNSWEAGGYDDERNLQSQKNQ